MSKNLHEQKNRSRGSVALSSGGFKIKRDQREIEPRRREVKPPVDRATDLLMLGQLVKLTPFQVVNVQFPAIVYACHHCGVHVYPIPCGPLTLRSLREIFVVPCVGEEPPHAVVWNGKPAMRESDRFSWADQKDCGPEVYGAIGVTDDICDWQKLEQNVERPHEGSSDHRSVRRAKNLLRQASIK